MVRHSNRASCCNIYPIFSSFLIIIVPLDLSKIFAKIERIVVLPDPDGPTIATNSPFFKENETSAIASISESLV